MHAWSLNMPGLDYKWPSLFSINDHGYCAENILDTMVARSIDVDVVDECGR